MADPTTLLALGAKQSSWADDGDEESDGEPPMPPPEPEPEPMEQHRPPMYGRGPPPQQQSYGGMRDHRGGPMRDSSYRGGGGGERGGGDRDFHHDRDYDRGQRGRGGFGGGGGGGERAPVPFPTVPPFKAFVGNLPPNVAEMDIRELFKGFDILDLYLAPMKDEGASRFGYVEFRSPDELRSALGLDGRELLGRNVRVDVAEPKKGGGGGRGYGGGGDRDGGFRSFNRRQDEPLGGYGDRGSGGGLRSSVPLPSSNAPAERPRLQLKPRSKPKTEEASPETRPASIFGGGKPHDELLYEKQHKLQREVPPLGRQDAPPSSKSSASKPQALEPQRRHKKDAKSNGDSQGAPGAGGGKRPQQEPSASGKGKEGKAPPATASNAAPSAAAPAPAPVPAPVPVEAKAPAGEASSPVEVGGKFSAATSKRKSGKKGRSSPDQKSAAAVTPPVKEGGAAASQETKKSPPPAANVFAALDDESDAE